MPLAIGERDTAPHCGIGVSPPSRSRPQHHHQNHNSHSRAGRHNFYPLPPQLHLPRLAQDTIGRPPPTMAQSTAHRRLLQEYRALTNNPPEGITAGPVSEDDLLHWECLIQGPEGTPFEGGVFPAELKFPKDYPLAPPSMKFLADVWHPNVYPSGLVCISILHPPGDDPNHYEHASERWSPIQSVEKILISVMSMLAEPNDESPANVEAAKMWRERRSEYENKVRDGVRCMLGL
ncbi:Ubiquitin-conjugating enzyme E2-18 kDa [Tolypocladium paradoxum]|uniref:Ubiquitin-conjugating enzyme E2 2 n=1 Tax=Tolypocladium paradoxum TaxID=94208 RepID=A0A2S4KUC0_9HYPO|nr:Ubiquitin-conjugating enzyme E2-18 kDa [Tolypocladium paradoxum]